MKAIVTAVLFGAAFAIGPVQAQNAQQPAATTSPQATSNASTNAASNSRMMLKDNWRASKLMGLDVYNESNEKLGDVNELILDKTGKVTAVVIGVGGFLGMGEHDIAVSMDKLRFVEEPMKTASNAPANKTTTGSSTAPAGTTTNTTASTNDWVPDHAVMAGNKDQLKAMPQFKYSDYN